MAAGLELRFWLVCNWDSSKNASGSRDRRSARSANALSRTYILVHSKHVGRVILGLDFAQTFERCRVIGVGDALFAFIGNEIDVDLARAVRSHCVEKLLRPSQML